ARELRTTVARAAFGVVEVVNAAMARALRVISVERGRDPREFTLVAFGGAAGVHACELAADLGVGRVLVPRHPGVLSAIGMAEAPLTRDHRVTVRRMDPPFGSLRPLAARLVARARAKLRREDVRRDTVRVTVQLRYLGQAHEIDVPLTADYRRRFDDAHRRLYGFASPQLAVEVLTLSVTVAAEVPRRAKRPAPRRHRAVAEGRHTLWARDRRITVPRYDRETLAPGAQLVGPALLVEYSSTV